KDGKPTYEYNWFGEARYRVRSSQKLSPGSATIRMEFKYDGGGIAKGGAVGLFMNDKKAGEGRIDKTEPVRFSANETLDTGLDSASPVSIEYQAPFRYTGTLKKVEIDVAPAQLSATDREKFRNAERDAAMAIE
ncbi:MAG TPA: arylsulfatase, partial [Terriglobia bacterium]